MTEKRKLLLACSFFDLMLRLMEEIENEIKRVVSEVCERVDFYG